MMRNIIREKRKERGLSQEELAKKCGVSRQTVNAIENDKIISDFGFGIEFSERIKDNS